MSTNPNEHGHGHGPPGKDHVPHVLPLSAYLATWLTLMVLTVITVAASYADFGSWNILIALGIATIKATVVAMMFMHLRYDHKFHAIIFSLSLVFLAIFIAFTMYDTETRGRTDLVQKDRPVDVRAPFVQGKPRGRQEAQLSKEYGVPPGQPLPQQPLTPPN
jgi:cytochrome c oxidase subunit 4